MVTGLPVPVPAGEATASAGCFGTEGSCEGSASSPG